MFRWFSRLRTDPMENRLRRIFYFLLNDYGFHFDKSDLGNVVNKDGEFVFYGPLLAYCLYNDNICFNILLLVQRQDCEIYITESHKNDQIYIRNGTRVSDVLAYDLDRFAVEVKNAIINGVEFYGWRI